MDPGSGHLRRADRLRSRKDFVRVQREGRRRSSRCFVVLMAPRFQGEPGQRPRLGVTASRKVGNAVVRNRVKRGIREWFRRSQDRLPRSQDVVVIARREAAQLSGPEIETDLAGLVQ